MTPSTIQNQRGIRRPSGRSCRRSPAAAPAATPGSASFASPIARASSLLPADQAAGRIAPGPDVRLRGRPAVSAPSSHDAAAVFTTGVGQGRRRSGNRGRGEEGGAAVNGGTRSGACPIFDERGRREVGDARERVPPRGFNRDGRFLPCWPTIRRARAWAADPAWARRAPTSAG